MQHFENTYSSSVNDMSRSQSARNMGDWSAEINGGGMVPLESAGQNRNRSANNMANQDNMANGGMMSGAMMNGGMMNGMVGSEQLSRDMQNNLSTDAVASPMTAQEAYQGSMKHFLAQNKGNYVVATFLIGTQGTTEFEGILYEVGNDYMVIYQQGRDRYIVCDSYSLKYIEFYDTERRQICNDLLRQQGMWPLPNRPEFA